MYVFILAMTFCNISTSNSYLTAVCSIEARWAMAHVIVQFVLTSSVVLAWIWFAFVQFCQW